MKHSIITAIGLLFMMTSSTCEAQNVALNFDGSDDMIQTTHSGISGQNSRTVEAMIRTKANCDPNNKGKQKVIVDWGAASTGARFTLNILYDNALRLEISGSGISGQTVINDGKWHHVAAVYSQVGKQNEVKLYVDGVLDTSGSIAPINTSSSVNVRIGQRVDGVSNFEGDIDEVRIFNRTRNQSEIKADMSKEYCSYPKGLVAYYKLNEGTAGSKNTADKTAKDYSSSKKNGTLSNFTLSGSASNWITGDTLSGGDSKTDLDGFGCYSYTGPDGSVYVSPGKYTNTLTNKAGCDSVVTLTVTLGRVYDFKRYTVCDSFVSMLGNVHYKTGFYRDTLVGVTPKGCDSVFISEVLVHQKKETQEDLVVCDSTEILGKTYLNDIKLVLNGTAVTGCDSAHTIDLVVNESSTSTLVETHCDRFTSSLGNTYTKTGTYKEKLSKANQYKCDSVITIDLTINKSSNLYFPVRDCDSFTSPSGKVYLLSGVHTEKFTTQFGCDSILVYDLSLSETKRVNEKVEACDSIMVNRIWRTATAVIEFTETSALGCDSFVSVDLTVTTIKNGVTAAGHTLTVNDVADSYQWLDCNTDKPINGETAKTFTAPYSGTFAADISVNDCVKRTDCYDVNGLGIAPHSSFDDSGFIITPNPNSGQFSITNSRLLPITGYTIQDISGRLLVKASGISESNFVITNDLSKGIYFITIQVDSKFNTQRFLVE